MTAYILAGVEVHDTAMYDEYVRNATPSLLEHDVKVRALCDDPTVLEGTDLPGRFVLLEVPDRAAAEAWYRCESYQSQALPIRHACARTPFLVVVDDAGTPSAS